MFTSMLIIISIINDFIIIYTFYTKLVNQNSININIYVYVGAFYFVYTTKRSKQFSTWIQSVRCAGLAADFGLPNYHTLFIKYINILIF